MWIVTASIVFLFFLMLLLVAFYAVRWYIGLIIRAYRFSARSIELLEQQEREKEKQKQSLHQNAN
ncbi:hypothetical protein BKH43_04620 [Helicobacter sp. 13S00401-1]|uniref:hypothetical protein n=1 Tax=Helicobacter sp. 13S00401-1 TaxID=1905758 RepID=UPI000BA6A011|nr:hypothetical protein [Helicobacter sp. 13S00401-1]PAF50379.1 hypothetical protein BKH43_04620 [Helicobacter sp. 13S00401-1]